MELTTWYLEMTEPARLRPPAAPDEPIAIVRAELASPELSRFLYTAVGGDWNWTDRLPWSWADWQGRLSRPGVETWMASLRGTPVGYFELDGHRERQAQIAYFGLLPAFIGRGIGGHLLATAIERAWTLSERWDELPAVERVWVHTCSMDGPNALRNYEARGLSVFKTVTEEAEPPASAPGPWPGADRPAPEDLSGPR